MEDPVPIAIEALPTQGCTAPGDDDARWVERTSPEWMAQRVDRLTPDLPTTPWGIAAADIDNDGDVDVYLPHFGPGEVFRNDGTGRLTLWREGLVGPSTTASIAASFVDIDGDGDLDLLDGGLHSLELYRNDGAGHLGPPERLLDSPGTVHFGVTVADIDQDDDLDLYVPRFPPQQPSASDVASGSYGPGVPDVLLVQENGVFIDQSHLLPQTNDGHTFAATFLDLDGDSAPEVLVCNDHGREVRSNRVFQRNDDQSWSDVTNELGIEAALDCMGTAPQPTPEGTALFFSGWSHNSYLTPSASDGWFESSVARGLVPADPLQSRVAWGGAWGDVQNDGLPDLFLSYGYWELAGISAGGPTEDNPLAQPDVLWRGSSEGRYIDEAERLGLHAKTATRAAIWVDLDHDGSAELLRRTIDGPATIFGRPCTQGAWVALQLAQPGGNTNAIGARVWLTTDTGEVHYAEMMRGGTALSSDGPPEMLLGLGAATRLARLSIRWPDGAFSETTDIDVRQRYVIQRETARPRP